MSHSVAHSLWDLGSANPIVRQKAIDTLVRLGEPGLRILIDALTDPSVTTRRCAIAGRDPAPGLRAALPVLRRLRLRDPVFREALTRIEAATVSQKDLPLSAPPPASYPAHLPIPSRGETDG